MDCVARDEIVRISSDDFRRARQALALAFFNYDLMVYTSADPRRRRSGVACLYGAILWDALRYGEVYVTHQRTGVACWLPPARAYSTFWRQARAGMLQLPFRFGVGAFRRLLPYDTVAQQLHHRHASMPHWYLAAIGVEPEHQGRGIGGALMQPILARADAERLACYLETHLEQNVRLYQRHGFAVVERADVPGHPLPVWAMLRPAH
jgi:GNAT superfamily N-acetyltransferase